MSKRGWIRSAVSSAFAAGAGLALLACNQPLREAAPTDCSVVNQYDLRLIDGFNNVMVNWFGSGDASTEPDGGASWADIVNVDPSTLPPAEVPPCPADPPLPPVHFTTSGNHNWGSIAGMYNELARTEWDASAYDGLSFWALSLYDKSLQITLDDETSASKNQVANGGVPPTSGILDATCEPRTLKETVMQPDGMGGMTTGMIDITNPAFYGPGGVPVANGCGDSFSTQLTFNGYWTFYTLPFRLFVQLDLDPRVKPNGIDKSMILTLSMRAPKDSVQDVWFSNFAWYRKAASSN